MIGSLITSDKGEVIVDGRKLSKSNYNPSQEIKTLFARVQQDYQTAYNLQHKPFDEFDGYSLLQRAKLDQETFGAFVGAKWVPQHKKWRWQGRKNTARNKLIGLLAHMISGMLYPIVHAYNEENENDKVTARVMRILVLNHLKKANYEMKFLYMVLSALVNPAVLVSVDYTEAWQKIKQPQADGTIKIVEAVDEFLTGLILNIVPVDQFLVADFYTPDIQTQPFVIKVERISWDTARKIYGDNEDFKFVEAGKTRIVGTGTENQTLYDVEWTEADNNYVQVITAMYRDEDLETVWVGGVFMGNKTDVYNTNPFKHRRLSLIRNTKGEEEWCSIPIYPYAKSLFEPIDPTGRFFYGKSGAFKLYWDDKTQNYMHQLWVDGTIMDVWKPTMVTGLANVDSTVLAPAAVVGMPQGATMSQYALGSNLNAAMQVLQKQESDESESTQDKIMGGQTTPGITATQTIQAQNQAKIMFGVFGLMVADLIKQIGELTVDCTVQHTTSGELDYAIPGQLRIKQKTLLVKEKDKGKDITNRIVFTDKFMGKKMTEAQKDEYEWKLWNDAGGAKNKDQTIYEVNPYRFARMNYSVWIDADQISNNAYGSTRMQKQTWFQTMIHPNIAPFTDPKAVADEMIDEFSAGDPDRFKKQGDVNEMMSGVMGEGGGKIAPGSMQAKPAQEQMAQALS